MSVVLPPSSDHFNSLPEIIQSDHVFKKRCTPEVLGDICQIFRKYRVQDIFGLALLHQHFEIQQNEKLVTFGNVAIPIRSSPDGLSVAASRWAFSGDKLIPYEFTAGAENIDMDTHVAFLVEMSQALRSSALADNLGLCSAGSIAGKDSEPTMEFTSGRDNVTLPFDRDPLEGNSVDAAWKITQGMNPLKTSGCEWLTVLRRRLRDSGVGSVQE